MASFEKVKDAVNVLHDNVSSLNTSVVSMSSQLKDTKADTQNLIELTKRLQLERYDSHELQKMSIQFNYHDACIRFV